MESYFLVSFSRVTSSFQSVYALGPKKINPRIRGMKYRYSVEKYEDLRFPFRSSLTSSTSRKSTRNFNGLKKRGDIFRDAQGRLVLMLRHCTVIVLSLVSISAVHQRHWPSNSQVVKKIASERVQFGKLFGGSFQIPRPSSRLWPSNRRASSSGYHALFSGENPLQLSRQISQVSKILYTKIFRVKLNRSFLPTRKIFGQEFSKLLKYENQKSITISLIENHFRAKIVINFLTITQRISEN